MTRPAAAQRSFPQDAQGPSQQRRHPRYTVLYRLRYSTKLGGKTVGGEGMLVDVSLSSCGIQGSRPVKPGDALTLEIQIPKSKVGVRLDGMRVMWASGFRFGVTSEECETIVSQLRLLPPELAS